MTSSVPGEAQRFREVITRKLGLHFDETKLESLSAQLTSRLASNRQTSDAYLARWERAAPEDEVRVLAPLLTVAETYFFRHGQQFQALRELALPQRWQARNGSRPLRILSAGCASGEEAYSIAITAREVLGEAACEISIRAVDLNLVVLNKARRARYNSWALRETPAEVREKWFHANGHGEFALDPMIREAVSFEEGNLNDQDAPLWCAGTYDIIFCRNVLMYFEPAAMRAVMKQITRALAPGGFLFLGHAETLRGISQDFHLCHTHDTFYYRARDNTDTTCQVSDGTGVPWSGPQARQTPQGEDDWSDAIQKATERVRSLSSPDVPSSAGAPRRIDLPLALDLLEQERYGEALALVQALPPEAIHDPDVGLLHAVLLTHRLQLLEAEVACRVLLTSDELNTGAHYLLALCRERAGDRLGAVEHDQYAIYLDPAFAMPRLHLGVLARRNHQLDLARRELARAHILLQREDASRLRLFGGGFSREALLALCHAELRSCGGGA